ncbi:hypothetical protein OAO18_06095 [Francisellaceae bacterium]|nr:hypothetical protein [Francisellaceae bacterium]
MIINDVLDMPFYHLAIEEGGVRLALRVLSCKLNIETMGIGLFRCSDTPIR